MLSLPFDIGSLLETAALALMGVWVAWYFLGAWIVSKWPSASAMTTAVDTSEQLAAYAALTAIRFVPSVASDPTAVANCEYLRGVVTAWKAAPTPAAKT
jgi:hypothetical protein